MHQKCFNSLQVVQNREIIPSETKRELQFQFLIGSLESSLKIFFYMFWNPFQFLIGSLESRKVYRGNGKENRFQFLIGSLESRVLDHIVIGDERFQFLIGSLESIQQMHFPCKCQIVSIPYRQSRITVHPQKQNRLLKVSIPYRQSRILLNEFNIELEDEGFNSLQVVQNPLCYTFLECIFPRFQFLIGSLESRHYSVFKSFESTFQFLIGSLESSI